MKPIQDLFYVAHVGTHKDIKDSILASIASMGIHSVIDEQQQLCNTDWYIPRDIVRPYYAIVSPYLEAHLKALQSEWGYRRNFCVLNYWFQEYANTDFHKLHIHDGCMFTNVYYVNLPKGASVTTITYKGKLYEVPVKEGDILSFPSCFEHESRPNNSDEHKVVIAFNTSLA